MAYRGKRNFTHRRGVPEERSVEHYRSYQTDDDQEESDGDQYYEENEKRSQKSLPKINKEKETRKTTEQSRYIATNESRIPVARRGGNKRVPNSRKEGPVTPVRERFRARYHVEQQDPNTSTIKEDQRSELHKNKPNNMSKRVTFYRNGDKHFKGRSVIITRQRYRSFESLLEDLSRAIPLPYGVRNIFSPDGLIINSINELEDGGYYICSSGDQLIKNINYKSEKRKGKSNDIPSEGIQNIKLSVPSDSSSNSSSPRTNTTTPKPRIITIINKERHLKCKILLNRKTVKSYEDILHDVSEMMKLQGEYVKELYSSQKSAKVGGLSEMFHGDDDVYTAIIVQDGSTKRNLSNPSSHSSNGGGISPSNGRKQKPRKKQRRVLDNHERGVTIKVKDKKLTFYPPSKRDATLSNTEEIFSVPSARPQLNWVYGYQGKETRYNLHVLPSGELLYFVSRVVVIYNRKNNTQRHYTEHADDIKCLAVHPNQWYIATGQTSGLSLDQNDLSHVRIWDSETLLTLTVLQFDDYSLSVIAMAFSVEDNGDVLSCIDSSGDSYRLSLWEWKDKKCLAQSKEFTSIALAVMFDPDDNKTIVSCGKEHVYFWRWHNGKLERKNGFFENNPVPIYVTCLDFAPNGDLFTGDSNGSITSWSKVSKKVKFVVRSAHEKSILCLHVLDSGLLLTAGGMDGRVCAWDANKYFNLPLREIQLPEMTGVSALQPLQTGETDVTLLAGTTANSILEGSFTKPFTTIVKGNKSDVLSFAVHPSRDLFVTASLDKTATLWSAVNHESIWRVDVEFPIRVAAFYPTGSVITFGTTQGRWIVLNADSGMHQASFQDGNEPITDLEYSPDGEHIAVGSKDGNIYVHAVYDDGMTYRRVGCCSNHTAPVLFLDWSVDGCFIQSMSTEYDIITWEIGGFEKEESQNIIRDTEWNTRNVVLGYDVVGVWQSTPTDGNLVTSSDLAWTHNLIAIGDELGYMRIFRYPCSYEGVQYHQVRAHSSTVLRVMFLSSDAFLLSTAGQDCAVLQWSMEGMEDPLTTRNKKPKSENLKILVSNVDDQSDIGEIEDYSSKEESERSRNELADEFDDEQEVERTGRGRHQRFNDDLNNSKRNNKPKAASNSIHGRNTKPDSDISDEAQAQTSEDYSSEDYKRQYEKRRPQGNEVKNVRGRRGRPPKQRSSFEEDMYRDRDDTSDERKERILRGRAKRYTEDDVSMGEKSDDDDITPRRILKSKQNGYRRARSPKDRNGRRDERDVGHNYTDEYSDTTRDDRNSYRNNKYGGTGRRNYKNDREPGYYRRNKR